MKIFKNGKSVFVDEMRVGDVYQTQDSKEWLYYECKPIQRKNQRRRDKMKIPMVGQRIKVRSEYTGAQDGGFGTIISVGVGSTPIQVGLDNGNTWYYEKYELILQKKMKPINGYRLLRDITLKAVWEEVPCDGDWNNFVKHIIAIGYNWSAAIDLKDCTGIQDSWDVWFVSRGFVEEEEDGNFKVETGDKFTIIDLSVMLCQVNFQIGFAILSDPKGWFVDSTLYPVADTLKITQREFAALCHGANWKEVYATRIPNKKD